MSAIAPVSNRVARSQLVIPQMEGLNPDINLQTFKLEMRNKLGISLETALTDATIDRTIEGASTLTVPVDDDIARTIQRSGFLGRKIDVNVDGLWFTLVGLTKQQRQLSLKFEDREINILRYYTKFIKADRDKLTRAQFILRMIQEVTEEKIPWVIPQLADKFTPSELSPGQIYVDASGKPLVDTSLSNPSTDIVGRSAGIPSVYALTVKGQPASNEQINNANTVLRVGQAMGARRKVLVVSIMTAIDESQIRNLPGGDRDSKGVFQQRPSQGWPASGDVATDAAAFFNSAMRADAINPNLSYNDLAQAVQNSGTPFAYGQYQPEAEAFVNAFGVTGGDMAGSPAEANNSIPVTSALPQGGYEFTRGVITQGSAGQMILKKENTWECIQRLAGEVGWRAFFVSGTFYFLSDEYLFQSKPLMTISEDSDGIDWIDYDYVEGKKVATVEVTAHLSRWAAPPGSIIRIAGQGNIIDGRYIVNEVSRSLFNTIATITLKKPQPILPEPLSNAAGKIGSSILPPQPGGARNGGVNIDIPANATAAKVVEYARAQLGVPYQWGGEAPGIAFDCSGLTQAAYDSANKKISRVAQDQFNAGPLLSVVDILQPGDLVFFGTDSKNVEHVGIYIGGGAMIDAPHKDAFVRVDDNFKNWTNPQYIGATRPWV